MAPGVVALAFLGERVLAVLRDPSPAALGSLGLVVGVVAVAFWRPFEGPVWGSPCPACTQRSSSREGRSR
jgi:hypothetical protein